MIVGLYDIDLYHKSKSYPNLELMQLYTYYYNKGNRVEMLKPKEKETKYSQIFYFKEFNTMLPKDISFVEDNKQIIGFGFYGKLPQLKKEITSLPPTIEPYGLYAHKIAGYKGYDSYLKSSIVRIETENFGGYKNESLHTYIVDSNFLYSAGAEDYLKNHLNQTYFFYHPLNVYDIETFNKFQKYNNLFFNREMIINFEYDENFFLKNFKDKIYFKLDRLNNEPELNYLLRIVKMILIYKNENRYLRQRIEGKTELEKTILEWGMTKNQLSYFDYYENSLPAQQRINGLDSELRLLLKQNPKKIDIKKIDLESNLQYNIYRK